MIRALVFDFDGLILDTETVLIESYGDVHAAHGLPFDRTEFIRHVGLADYTFNPWHALIATRDRDALEAQRQHFKDERLRREPVRPGVAALLDAARDRGLAIGLASNSSHGWVEPHLERLGLRDHFSFVACRGDAPSPKPAPDLYRLVLGQFGLTGPEAIAFEDSATGVIAAKSAGLWCVAVPNASTGHHDLGPADLRASSLAEISLDDLAARFA
jgi:HAD superfamily hydrolase (TIGR01509 family)